jgi:hypothetical protein
MALVAIGPDRWGELFPAEQLTWRWEDEEFPDPLQSAWRSIVNAIFILVGILGVVLLLRELAFSRTAIAVSAVAIETSSRGTWGFNRSKVAYPAGDGQTIATIYSALYRPRRGDQVAILYSSANPSNARFDSIWDRYLLSGLCLLIFGRFALSQLKVHEGRSRAKRRRVDKVP